MGLVNANIEIINSDDLALVRRGYLKEDDVKRIQVEVLVNTGSYMLAINEDIKIQLDLLKVDEQEAELADGTLKRLDVVDPIEIKFKNRRCSCDAMVLPGKSQILLGAIPMEDMDLVVDPKKTRTNSKPSITLYCKKISEIN